MFSVEMLLDLEVSDDSDAPSHCHFLSTGLCFDRRLTRCLKGLWIYLVSIIVYVFVDGVVNPKQNLPSFLVSVLF